MKIKHWSLLFLLLIGARVGATEGSTLMVPDEQHIKVALRMIGHKLMQSLGDSTSRILPVEQHNGQYTVPINTDFQFDPADLAVLIEEVAKSADLPRKYIVEVESCASQEIVYAYEVGHLSDKDIIPCRGRLVPKACYQLLFTFPDLPSSAQKLLAATQAERFSKRGPLLLSGLLLLIVPLLFLGRRLRSSRQQPEAASIGDFRFDRDTMQLSWQGATVELTSKESELLLLLHDHTNETLEREVLLEHIWGDEGNYVGRTLDVFISRLRKKLQADPQVKIANIRGVGYKLVVAK